MFSLSSYISHIHWYCTLIFPKTHTVGPFLTALEHFYVCPKFHLTKSYETLLCHLMFQHNFINAMQCTLDSLLNEMFSSLLSYEY